MPLPYTPLNGRRSIEVFLCDVEKSVYIDGARGRVEVPPGRHSAKSAPDLHAEAASDDQDRLYSKSLAVPCQY